MYLVMYMALLSLAIYDVFVESNESDKSNEELKEKIFIGVNILLVIIASLRHYIGTDYGTYVEIFNGIHSINDYSYLEIGFRFIIVLIKTVTHNSNWLFVVMAAISIYYLYKGIKESSKKPLVSIFIYFNIFYIGYIFNAMRQGFAMSIFLYSLKYFKAKDLKKIIILSIIASTIHSSGLYILLAYVLKYVKIEKKLYPYIVGVGVILCLFNPFEFIITNIPIPVIREKFMVYSQYSENIGLVSIAQRLIILVLLIINNDKFEDEEDRSILNIYIWGWILYCILSFDGVITTRVNMFFRVLEVILLPNLINKIDDIKMKKLIYVFIVLWTLATLFINLRNPDNFPYKIINLI